MIFSALKVFYYEFLSYFVPQKVAYKIEGSCKKCGACCNYMYSFDTYTEKEFKIMQFLYPKYKRFEIAGEDSEGNLFFRCKLVQDNGLCGDYKNRLRMCRNYPKKKIHFNGELHKGCGYKITPENTFEDILKKEKKKFNFLSLFNVFRF